MDDKKLTILKEEFEKGVIQTQGKRGVKVPFCSVMNHFYSRLGNNGVSKEEFEQSLRCELTNMVMKIEGDMILLPQKNCREIYAMLRKSDFKWLAAIIFCLFQYAGRGNDYILITNSVEKALDLNETFKDKYYGSGKGFSKSYSATRVRRLLSSNKGILVHNVAKGIWGLNSELYSQLQAYAFKENKKPFLSYEQVVKFVSSNNII